MPRYHTPTNEPIELDLFFQIWRADVEAPDNYCPRLLYECYLQGKDKQRFYDEHVYLPF